MRRIARVLVVIAASSIAAMLLAAEVAQDPADQREVLDQFLFKGRLVGISFSGALDAPEAAPRIRLQFVVEEPYAMLLGDRQRGRLSSVRTEWVADLDAIVEENYVKAVEGMLQTPIHLGQSCLVHSMLRGMREFDLVAVEPATGASEAAYLERHREYLLKFERRQIQGEIRAKLLKLGTIHHEIGRMKRMNESVEHAGEDVAPEIIDHIRNLESELEQGCVAAREHILNQQASIRSKLEQEIRSDAKVNMEGMIADFDEILVELNELCDSNSNGG